MTHWDLPTSDMRFSVSHPKKPLPSDVEFRWPSVISFSRQAVTGSNGNPTQTTIGLHAPSATEPSPWRHERIPFILYRLCGLFLFLAAEASLAGAPIPPGTCACTGRFVEPAGCNFKASGYGKFVFSLVLCFGGQQVNAAGNSPIYRSDGEESPKQQSKV